jgi:hypothetical protein
LEIRSISAGRKEGFEAVVILGWKYNCFRTFFNVARWLVGRVKGLNVFDAGLGFWFLVTSLAEQAAGN